MSGKNQKVWKNKTGRAAMAAGAVLGFLTLQAGSALASPLVYSTQTPDNLSQLNNTALLNDGISSGAYSDTAFPHTLQDPTRQDAASWLAVLQKKDGSAFVTGQGDGASQSFDVARLGNKNLSYNENGSIEGSLLGLTSNAHFAAVGFNLGEHSRLAVGSVDYRGADFSSSQKREVFARGAAVTYTTQPSKAWTFSLSNSFLRERNMLLGSPASLGNASTVAFGAGATFEFGAGYRFGVDAIVASSTVSQAQGGPSNLRSAGFNIAIDKENIAQDGDDAGIYFKKPLQIYSGSAADVSSYIPTGNETDIGVQYKVPVTGGAFGTFSLSYRNDADNVAGAKDTAAFFHLTAKF